MRSQTHWLLLFSTSLFPSPPVCLTLTHKHKLAVTWVRHVSCWVQNTWVQSNPGSLKLAKGLIYRIFSRFYPKVSMFLKNSSKIFFLKNHRCFFFQRKSSSFYTSYLLCFVLGHLLCSSLQIAKTFCQGPLSSFWQPHKPHKPVCRTVFFPITDCHVCPEIYIMACHKFWCITTALWPNECHLELTPMTS